MYIVFVHIVIVRDIIGVSYSKKQLTRPLMAAQHWLVLGLLSNNAKTNRTNVANDSK